MERLWQWGQLALKWLMQDWTDGRLFHLGVWLIAVVIFACVGRMFFEILVWLFSKARTRIAYKLTPFVLWLCAGLAMLGSGGFALWAIGCPSAISWIILPWGVALLAGPLLTLLAVTERLAERTRMGLILAQPHAIP